MDEITDECRSALEAWVRSCPHGDDRGLSLTQHPCGELVYMCNDSNIALRAFHSQWQKRKALEAELERLTSLACMLMAEKPARPA